jgi:RNA polymerase sigma-70 factor (ECF subfamily)
MYAPIEPQRPTWDWTAARAICLREARRVLGHSPEAEDAAQEATLRAWRNRSSCRAAALRPAWLATIARREALRLATRRRELPLEEAAEPGACEEEQLLLRRSVRAAVAELAPEERRVLLGCYWHDLSGSELSLALGRAEVTVRVQLHRARGRLRESLGGVR